MKNQYLYNELLELKTSVLKSLANIGAYSKILLSISFNEKFYFPHDYKLISKYSEAIIKNRDK